MLPTIDLSNLGVGIGIASVLKWICGSILSVATWAKNQLITLILGSKVWATAFFLAIAITIIGLLNTLFSKITSFLATIIVGGSFNVQAFAFEFGVANQALPFTKVFALISWCFNWTFSVFVVERNMIWFRRACDKFMLVLNSWRT